MELLVPNLPHLGQSVLLGMLVGPVERRLNSFGRVNGWVFGAFGETSEQFHTLVQKLAEARVAKADTMPGQSLIFKSKAAQMAGEVGFLR